MKALPNVSYCICYNVSKSKMFCKKYPSLPLKIFFMYCNECNIKILTINLAKRDATYQGHWVRYAPLLNPPFQKLISQKGGIGLFNSLLSLKILSEMHLPGYSFACPFMILGNKIEHVQFPINCLHEAAIFHDLKCIITRKKACRRWEDAARRSVSHPVV